MIDDVEPSAIGQVTELINHKGFTNSVVMMPDIHQGTSSPIGFTMPIGPYIVPNTVSVDIGCGLLSTNLGRLENLDLARIEQRIRQHIPFGFDINDRSVINVEREYDWKEARARAQSFAVAYQNRFSIAVPPPPYYDIKWLLDKCHLIGCDPKRVLNSLMSNGGSNHFIEIGKDLNKNIWITDHTGSRNLGKAICGYWQGTAIKNFTKRSKADRQEAIADLKSRYTGKELYEQIKAYKASPDPVPTYPCSDELRWLEGDQAIGYLYDMIFAQHYAETNRNLIIKKIVEIIKSDYPETEIKDSISTTHNYIDFRDFIIRKGAIRSYIGERMLIPYNMRDGILICEGLSNPEWNYSAPHGAGRNMSRAKAKKTLDVNTYKRQMTGIYSTTIATDTLDESPSAYKDSRIIEEALKPTAVILNRIKPLINMKAGKIIREEH